LKPTLPAASIFNDVLGPVMRGPSSSHSAAANRIGRLCRDLVEGDIRSASIEYDPSGSLVTTHVSQGTDMGLYGGFLGWEADDERLPDYLQHLGAAGIQVDVQYVSYDAPHPNHYRLQIEGTNGKRHRLEAISTGGGMIELTAVDAYPLSVTGGYHELLVYVQNEEEEQPLKATISSLHEVHRYQRCEGEGLLLCFSFAAPVPPSLVKYLEDQPGVGQYRVLKPVLPILSHKDVAVPFQTVEAMLAWNEDRQMALWELAVAYECARGGITASQVLEKAHGILNVMEESVRAGLAGTDYADRILPCQSAGFAKSLDEGRLIPGDGINRIIAFITAIMEVKSSMGLIVAAPTAGSCGAMPGSVLAVADLLGSSQEEKVQALLTAGLIGMFVTTHATFAAEIGGCMAECGSGAGMAAAAMVGLNGGTLNQQLSAASVALQNSFGMTCDPVANRVEAPCLGKNVLAGTNALACANMALADYRHLIPLDQVIEAMDQVGRQIPHELSCTGKGGLSMTPAAKAIERSLKKEAC
jgi:L-serine dehydratase